MAVQSNLNTSLIPQPKGIQEVIHKDGDTWDIVEVILMADQKLGTYMCSFASQFERSYAGLYLLWDFVHRNIQYKADRPGHEKVKDPRVTWKDRFGDCKSFSLFIASVLRCLKIKYRYRFAAYHNSKHPTHVYVVATLNNVDIILDGVHKKFDDEAEYTKKWDKMTRISYLRGIHSSPAYIGIAKPTRAERIADAPKATAAKPPLKITGLTEGQLTLELLTDQLNIIKAFYGDPEGIIQQGLNLIHKSKFGDFHYNKALPVGYIDPRLFELVKKIQAASNNTRINGTPVHIGDLTYNKPKKYPTNCNDIYQSNEYSKLSNELFSIAPKIEKIRLEASRLTFLPDKQKVLSQITPLNQRRAELLKFLGEVRNDVNECLLANEFGELLSKKLEACGHHVLYEFVSNPNQATNVVATKHVLHQVALSTLSNLAYIDRGNVRLMVENGIMRKNTLVKGILNDITPKATIEILRQGGLLKSQQSGIGIEPVTTAAVIKTIQVIVGILVGALSAAALLLQQMNERKRLEFNAKSQFGQFGFGPDPNDWLTDPSKTKSKESSFSNLLSEHAPVLLLGTAGVLFLTSK